MKKVDDFVHPPEAAAISGVSVGTIRNWIKDPANPLPAEIIAFDDRGDPKWYSVIDGMQRHHPYHPEYRIRRADLAAYRPRSARRGRVRREDVTQNAPPGP